MNDDPHPDRSPDRSPSDSYRMPSSDPYGEPRAEPRTDPRDDLLGMRPPRPGSRRSRRRSPTGPGVPWLPILVVLLGAGGLAWWWFGRSGSEPDPMAGPAFADTALTGAEVPDTLPLEPLELPPLGESDALVGRLAGALSAHPRWAAWLVHDRLVERFVTSVVTLAAGNSPREHVPFLVPEQDFRVRTAGGGHVVDPATYRRYDAFADALVGLERSGAVRLYRQLAPLFEEAYGELGFPPEQFHATLARAIDNLLAVPVPDGAVGVREGVEGVDTYAFTDPALEARSPAEKHVIRLGPENALRVQAKLRQLRAALAAAGALPSAASPAG
jgi:hypothetical protein